MSKLSTSTKMEDSWRWRIDTYAHHVSKGRWWPYAWIVYVLRIIQAAVLKGGARIIFNAPPRHGKSEGVSHWLPTWFLDHFPDKRVILGSHGDDLASDWGLKVRDKFTSDFDTWTRLRKDKRRIDNWTTVQGGGMRSMGVGGSITGRGGDLIVVDDAHKDWAEAMSFGARKRITGWFNATLYPRLEPGGSIIVMQTRWHEDDLSGYLFREHSDNWVLIRLPAIAEEEDLLGRSPGDALCPERFSREQLDQIQEAMGTQLFAGLYQQRPAPLEGNLVRRDWFRRYEDLPETFDCVIQSWDMNFKATDGGSFVVGQVWGRSSGKFFLLDQVRGRWSFVETQRHMRLLSVRWPEAREKYVEEAANGPAIISSLTDEIPGIIPIRVKNSKGARLAAVSGFIESGNVYLPKDSLEAENLIEEVCTFPYGMNDDQVDAMTQALDKLYSGGFNFNLSISDAGVRSNPWNFS